MGDEERPTVTIRVPGAQNLDRGVRDSLLKLRTELQSDDYDARFPLVKSASTSIQNSLESVGIFIAGGVSATLLPLIVTDVYDGVKRWMLARFTKDESADAVYVTIYGPDGKPLQKVLGRGCKPHKGHDARSV